MTPVLESVEDLSDCVDDVVKDNDFPRSTLCIERSWRVEELELFLESRLARLRLAKQQELNGHLRKGHSPRIYEGDAHLNVLFRAFEPLFVPPNFVVDTI